MAKFAFPPTRWEQLLPPPPSAVAQKRLLRVQRRIVTRIQGRVTCQRDNVELFPLECLERQFDVNCLGCPAPCHLCHACHSKRLAFQDIELCRPCLRVALKDEVARGLPAIPPNLKFYCQWTRGTIEYADCVKLQQHQTPYEEQCLFCLQPSYQCQRCRKFPSRYPNQGLCLHCMVDGYDGMVEDPRVEAIIAHMRALSLPSPAT